MKITSFTFSGVAIILIQVILIKFARTQSCGGLLRATNVSRPLTSPNYPSYYTNNLRCRWNITAPAGLLAQFTVWSLSTESCCDYLQVTWGNRVTQLRNLRHNVTFVSDSIGLYFYTDGSVTRRGFRGSYSVTNTANHSFILPPTTTVAPCGFSTQATNVSQTLNSPGYPGTYQNRLNCRWNITARPGMHVQFSFSSFVTESCCDYLRVYNSYPPSRRFAGYVSNTTVVSVGNVLQLYFRTDSSVTRTGFRGSFIETEFGATTPAPTTTTAPTPCGGNYTANSSRQYLTSPGYPSRYSNSEICIWEIQARSGYLILLQVVRFRTENCCDRLTITGLQNTVTLAGSLTPRHYFSQSNYMRLRFRSDGSVTYTGFQLWFQESRSGIYPTTTAEPPTTQVPCGMDYDVTNNRQLLTSPNYPANYLRERTCFWNLTAPASSRISLTLDVFSTESCCDILEVSRLVDFQSSNGVAFLYGNLSRRTYYSESNTLSLVFVSDSSTEFSGFQFSFTIAAGVAPTNPPITERIIAGPQTTTSTASTNYPITAALITTAVVSVFYHLY